MNITVSNYMVCVKNTHPLFEELKIPEMKIRLSINIGEKITKSLNEICSFLDRILVDYLYVTF